MIAWIVLRAAWRAVARLQGGERSAVNRDGWLFLTTSR